MVVGVDGKKFYDIFQNTVCLLVVMETRSGGGRLSKHVCESLVACFYVVLPKASLRRALCRALLQKM